MQAGRAAGILGDLVVRKYPFAGATQPMVDRPRRGAAQPHLAPGAVGDRRRRPAADRQRRQRAAAADRRSSSRCGCRPRSTAARRPPSSSACSTPIRPPGASVAFTPDQGAAGWNAPPTAPWLAQALEEASQTFYGKPVAAMGEGGTIPFMAMLGRHFPARAVPDHRRARAALERARAQRIPAHPLRDEAHRLRRAGPRRARGGRRVIGVDVRLTRLTHSRGFGARSRNAGTGCAYPLSASGPTASTS